MWSLQLNRKVYVWLSWHRLTFRQVTFAFPKPISLPNAAISLRNQAKSATLQLLLTLLARWLRDMAFGDPYTYATVLLKSHTYPPPLRSYLIRSTVCAVGSPNLYTHLPSFNNCLLSFLFGYVVFVKIAKYEEGRSSRTVKRSYGLANRNLPVTGKV
jgi:hypothetical protein